MDSNFYVPRERDTDESAWGIGPGEVSRRAFLGGSAALGATFAMPKAAFASAPTYSANALYQSIGICTHPNWRSTNWGTLPWEDALISTGVRHARGEIGHGWAADGAMAHLSKFFAAGGKFCAMMTGRSIDKTTAKADVDYLATKVAARYLTGIESMNEFNSPKTRPTDWAAQLKDFQAWLYTTVRANQSLATVPVVAPSIWGRTRSDYLALGNLEPNVNKDCMHYYSGGMRPTMTHSSVTGDTPIQQVIADAHIIAPREKLYTTEFGYDTPGPNSPLSPWVVTQKAAAKYIVRGQFDLFANGSERAYVYELMDDPGTNHYWGLCDATLKPKLQYRALRNTMALIRDNYVRVGSLAFSLSSNAPADLKQYVFCKSDGSYLLVLYRDIDSYDRRALRDIDAAPIYVTVNLGVTARKIEFFRPTFEAASLGTASGRSTLATVDDQVTIIKITP
jgi:hypothetical protein